MDREPEGRPARRRFLAALGSVAGALAAALGAVPLLGSLLAPLRRGAAGAGGFVRVARLASLPQGRPVRVPVVAEARDAWARLPPAPLGAALLVRRGDTVRAFTATCPHLACSVEVEGSGFHCPCHDSRFGLDGEVRGGPAPRGLDALEVRVLPGDDPDVEVRWRRFPAGGSRRGPA